MVYEVIMVFALPPNAIFEMLDWSVAKWLLVNKKSNPTKWRILSDIEAGKTKRPRLATVKWLLRLFIKKVRIPGIVRQIRQIPDGLPWERAIRSFNIGNVAAGGEPSRTLEQESLRLERLADTAKVAIQQGDFQTAYDHIGRSKMPPLPSLKWIMGQIDCRGPIDRFAASACPLTIVTTLYLLACLEVDKYDADEASGAERLLPELRDGCLIRPMTRWLEGVKAANELPTVHALYDCLLAQGDDDVRREVRKWRGQGDIPSWSRVTPMVSSISEKFGRDKKDEIERKVRMGLAIVRILDGLLKCSLEIRDRYFPDYDPLAPFRDYPLMYAHAGKVKAALPPLTEQ
jgi:hypothetical protein